MSSPVFVPGVEPTSPGREPAIVFLVHRRGLAIVREDNGVVRMPTENEARPHIAPPAKGASPGSTTHYLGRLGGADVLTAACSEDALLEPPFEVIGLRGLFGEVDDVLMGIGGRAVQIVEWAATHRFCGRCATPTERTTGERAMRCPACSLTVYPRIAPAIIVLIRRGDEALLAHGARFPMPMYSTLAGFVEAGETLEECLVREVKEEVGVEVNNIRYFGSQSWPFPNSLMVGFFAEWAGGDIQCDPSEILDAKWFRADALPMMPPPMSISRKLIDSWLDEVRTRACQLPSEYDGAPRA